MPEPATPRQAPQPPRPRLLVAEDEPDLLMVMTEALKAAGFEVSGAFDGEDALAQMRAAPPDIAVVDLWMPRKDGMQLCRELKEDPQFEHLPIILLSGASDRDVRIQGMELGADDFIRKPVDLPELVARLRMILRRTRMDLDANPLTRLPGNAAIETRIQEALAARAPLAVLYLDLNEFKAYNDVYGFEAGDRVLQSLASLLLRLAREKDGDFIGHIGGDDFILLTRPERMQALCESIVAEFDRLAPGFYNEEDRARGSIRSVDRKGRPAEFPLLSIAIGVCHNRWRPLLSSAQVSQIASELKKHAKEKPGSRYVIDRRREG